MQYFGQEYCIIFGTVTQSRTFVLAVIFIPRKKVITMPRRKKFQKLPNGYGQIRYLGKGRRNPYGVYPPATEEYDNGKKKTPPALCYVSDRMVGLAVLTSYKAGTYKPGDEILIEKEMRGTVSSGTKVLDNLVTDYNKAVFSIEQESRLTFQEVFEKYYLDKYGHEYGHKGKKTSAEASTCTAYKKCGALYELAYESLKAEDMQRIIDDIADRLSHASAELPLTLFHQMDRYALANDICEKGYAQFVRIKTEDDDEHGVPFSDRDLKTLWEHKDDETVEFILIMCYSGFRISAYHTIEIDLKKKYFKGGIKTDAGKDRVVPIHSAILPLVQRRMKRYGCVLRCKNPVFRRQMYAVLEALSIEKHTPHDCRHTFSMLCEKYGVNENDRKRMLGHAFSSDVTNRVYGHRTLEDLRKEIEKIKT